MILLDQYTVNVNLPQGTGHFLDPEMDEMIEKLNDLPTVIKEAVGSWVRERVPEATVEVT